MHRSMSAIGEELKVVKGQDPQNASAGTTNGPAIDRRGYGSCVLHHACGVASGAPASRTVDTKLQDSADGSTGWNDYVPPTGTAAATQLVADSTEAEKDVDLSGAKGFIRTVRVVAFTGGTTPAIAVQASVTLGGATTVKA
jgi:hypothetical protein